MQPGDVYRTWADTRDFSEDFLFKPQIPIETGVANFVKWYLEYYQK